tara:strand:- start:1684 stop:2145 length:462 start_codon:yes stop_codon:yes gene_type:complete
MDHSSPYSQKLATPEQVKAFMKGPKIRNPSKDYFVERDGKVFAGTHILVDLWGAKSLNDTLLIEKALREAIKVCGASLLHIHLHEFGEGLGISGVAVLAESHISVHTWPERQFAAFDIFMCGDCIPELALPVFKKFFKPEKLRTNIQMRGIVT